MQPHERRELERQALRTTILDTARRLFAADGYERVTMRRIADEIGYSATTIYHHFPDKLGLMHALCDEDFAQLQATFAQSQVIADPVERLRGIGMGYAAFAATYPNHFRLLFMTRLSDDERVALSTASQAKRGDPAQDGYALLVQAVAAAIAAGRMRPAYQDAHLAAQILWAGVHGVCVLDLDHGNDGWVPWAAREVRVAAVLEAMLAGMTIATAPAGQAEIRP
jgi:AcrR family transcriptional regulator